MLIARRSAENHCPYGVSIFEIKHGLLHLVKLFVLRGISTVPD